MVRIGLVPVPCSLCPEERWHKMPTGISRRMCLCMELCCHSLAQLCMNKDSGASVCSHMLSMRHRITHRHECLHQLRQGPMDSSLACLPTGPLSEGQRRTAMQCFIAQLWLLRAVLRSRYIVCQRAVCPLLRNDKLQVDRWNCHAYYLFLHFLSSAVFDDTSPGFRSQTEAWNSAIRASSVNVKYGCQILTVHGLSAT